MAKVLGYTLLVVFVLFIISPWIINLLSLDAVSKAYDCYCNWVNSLFPK